MFKNYFKTAIRNLKRNKNFAAINILGLGAGIAVCLIIFVIIQFELSVDNFHSKKDRIYRVLTEYHHADAATVFYGPGVPFPMPKAIRNDFPEVEKVATIYSEYDEQILVLNENGQAVKKFKEERGVFFMEPSFFEIFDFPWLAGNPATSLNNPNTAVLSKEIANKYFGDWRTAIGKNIKLNNRDIVKITGILANIPANSDFQLKVIVSYGTGFTANFLKSTNFANTGSNFVCYILLSPHVSASSFNTQLRKFSKKYEPADDKDSHIIQPLAQVHFDGQTGNFSGKTISPQLIKGLWLIGAFILLIACVNFVNLSTAQAVNRAREVGIRKVLGSNKWQLLIQFLVETAIIVLSAVLLSVVIAFLILPPIGKILDISLSFKIFQSLSILYFLLIILLVVTVLSGFYPSLVLSRFNPINALKSKLSAKSTKGISLRRGLVVFQFIIAQALIIGTLIIVKQMNYFNNRALGFDKEAIVNVPFPDDSTGISKLNFLRKRLSEVKDIRNVSFSSNTPIEDNNDNWTTFKFDHAPKETGFYAINKWADHLYLPTYRLPLAAGRNIEPSDTIREFLVNETLVRKLGITPLQALNKQINLWDGQLKGPIVGVIKDFHDRSLRVEFAPVLIGSLKRGYSLSGIKLVAVDPRAAIKSIEKIWSEIFPDFVFEYKFLDAKINDFYKQENQLSQLYKIFAAKAIMLSCLGLYGLASFMAVQRIKEVGIRKVLGASATNIVYLFSKEFMLLIGIAFVIAAPIAGYLMHTWLQDFVFRINISWWIFAAGWALAILIAMLTVSFQALKAALTSPVKSLRTE